MSIIEGLSFGGDDRRVTAFALENGKLDASVWFVTQERGSFRRQGYFEVRFRVDESAVWSK